MLKYRPFEMHCHTRHSDGTFLVPQLIESVAAYGYAGLALTDHNAVTGLLEVTEELQRKNNCLVLPGIEWTTFYGHLLVIGCDRFVDWRFVTPDTIDEALQEIRAAGGIAGVAHPCEVGSPLMCGCFPPDGGTCLGQDISLCVRHSFGNVLTQHGIIKLVVIIICIHLRLIYQWIQFLAVTDGNRLCRIILADDFCFFLGKIPRGAVGGIQFPVAEAGTADLFACIVIEIFAAA